MTPLPRRANRRRAEHHWLGMTIEAAIVFGCIIAAIAIVYWAA